jgi:hypothetical protein
MPNQRVEKDAMRASHPKRWARENGPCSRSTPGSYVGARTLTEQLEYSF